MRRILEKLKGLFNWKGVRKKQVRKREGEGGKGYSSPEAFHKHFEERYGKPGRIPEDV